MRVDEPLRTTRVAVVGAGGLGTPALLALLHAGAERLHVVEPDRVERTNLHRQLFYRDADVGRPKVDVLVERVAARWPHVALTVDTRPFVAGRLPEHVGLVLDGTDDLGTKLALADACVDARVPFVFAGVVGWDGQVLGVWPERSPCPRCLFEVAPPPGAAPTCEQVGVLGPVAGVVAARQVQVARSLLGPAPLVGALWVYDGRSGRAREVRIGRDPACRGCGAPRVREPSADARAPAAPWAAAAAVDAELDLTGLACPETFRRTRRRLEDLAPGATLRVVLSSDESSRVVPASLAAAGHHVRARGVVDGRHVLLVERAADPEAP